LSVLGTVLAFVLRLAVVLSTLMALISSVLQFLPLALRLLTHRLLLLMLCLPTHCLLLLMLPLPTHRLLLLVLHLPTHRLLLLMLPGSRG
jgi:cytochrome c biogenesis protein CcdA